MKTNPIIDEIKSSNQTEKLQKGENFCANSIQSLGLNIVASFSSSPSNIAVVLPSLFDAQNLVDFLTNFLDSENILFFPYDEVLRADTIYSSKEFLKERLYSLGQLTTSNKKHIFITHAISLLHQVSSRFFFGANVLKLETNQTYSPLELSKWLIEHGYSRVNKVEEVFEFSWRGEIIDIFTPSNTNPYRIEYFDDQIEEIREFHSETEMSFNKVKQITLIPGSENIFTKEQINLGTKRIQEELDTLPHSALDEELSDKTRSFLALVEEEGLNDTKSRYLPYFVSSPCSILSYLEKYKLYFYRFEDVQDVADHYFVEASEYMGELRIAKMALPHESLCFRFEDSLVDKPDYNLIIDEDSRLDVTDIPYHFSNINSSCKLLDTLIADGYKTYVYIKEDQIPSFEKVCEENNKRIDLSLTNNGYQVVISKGLSSGFLLPKLRIAVVSSKEIFGVPDANSVFLKRFKEAKIIGKYQDLVPGDYVVHQEQGIGEYLGIITIDGLEYLGIRYAGEGEKLYVPLKMFKMIRKYSSKEGVKPKLDRLGGATWARRKAKIRGRVSYLADRLIEIEAQRNSLPGFAFQADDELEKSFSDSFAYNLTPSQVQAWEDIKQDMMSPHPMDRLLTGDVGFGKTEVAFKAIFKCICSGKQAALLCPTTVLCNQHYQVALKRFEGFGVNIAILNRNVSLRDVKTTLLGLKTGQIHFVIGTHKLLGEDVKFDNLGLLVVDEEQRFGVTHKEKIKSMTTNIDVLTLTATPIPRTLQMSLLNVRSLSLLQNPPINRLPIKTYVVRYDIKLIKEVITRELGRHGQVYYLHNRVATIYKKMEELQKLFPSCVIGAVHGQLDAEDISSTMADFYDGKIDILVCTSIVETGLDVPNCNTIIVEKAENFGLAQLYQIKGRVGRSSRLAYAYLTYPDYGVLNEESTKRLKALKEFTELGSGYKIATEDLNIRGAGDILGKEQAGFIDSIGYDSYMKLLQDVMKEKKVQVEAKQDKPIGTRFELSFSLDAHIPSNYASEHDRINIYREMFDIGTIEDLREFKKKIKDIYGHFSEELENFFLKREVEILISRPIFEEFNEYIDRFEMRMTRDYSCSYRMAYKINDLMSKYQDKPVTVRFLGTTFRISLIKTVDYLMDLYEIVSMLIKLQPEGI